MFSHEDQIRIHKQKTKLQAHVTGLIQRRNTLQFEAQKSRENRIPNGDLIVIKAITRLDASVNNYGKVNEIMTNYVEMVREVTALEAACDVLEQTIREEQLNRSQTLSESSAIAKLFDMSPWTITLPILQDTVDMQENLSVSNKSTIRIDQKMSEVNSELISLDIPKPTNPRELDAALEIARCSEAQCNLKAAGSLSLRSDIQRLQRFAAESDLAVKQAIAAKDSESEDFVKHSGELDEQEAAATASFEAAKAEFQKLTREADDQIEALRERMSYTAATYDDMCRELDQLEQAPFEMRGVSEGSSQIDYTSEEEENRADECLLEQRNLLQNEVKNLKMLLKEQKQKAKVKEAALLDDVKNLKEQYYRTKQRVQSTVKMVELNSSSNLRSDIAVIIGHIDSSIMELRELASRDVVA
jgi:hypothetical protein